MKNRLKEFRAIHDTTQEELANKLDVTRQTILAIEKDKYDPSLKLAIKIAKFFDIPVEELFIDEEEIKREKERKKRDEEREKEMEIKREREREKEIKREKKEILKNNR